MPRTKETRRNRITVVLEESLKDRIEYQAIENQRSISDFVRLVLLEYCDALEGEEQVVIEDEDAE